MTDSKGTVLTSREWLVALALGILTGAAGALAMGQPWNPDLDTYHFYNGFALIAGRLDQDIAPSGPGSYFNPLLDVVHYLGVRYVHPAAFTAFLGAVQGLNIVLLWAIARRVLGARPSWLAPLAAILGGCGANALSLLGDTFGDNTVSIPALAALLALLGAERPRRGRLALSGALGGAAVGLKLTMAVPHLALGAAAAWVAWDQRRPLLLLSFALGTLAGWGLTNGWWAVLLWQRFGNPFFPFFNNLFHSPFLPSEFLHDARWAPNGLHDWVRAPLDAARGIHARLQEVPFRDARLLTALLAQLAWLLSRVRAGGGWGTRNPRRILLLYWVLGYAAWAALLGYYRYATFLEMLAPLVALAVLQTLWPRRVALSAAMVALGLLLTTEISPWPRTKGGPSLGFRPFWYRARLPPSAADPGQLVLLPQWKTSYAAPFFPDDAAFVSLAYGDWWGPAMEKAITERIASHPGPIRVLERPLEPHEGVLEVHGLTQGGPCAPVRFGRERRLQLCPVVRGGSAVSRAQDVVPEGD